MERHWTASETSTTEASIPMVTTFTGTATVFPVSTAVFKISESCRETWGQRDGAHQFSYPQITVTLPENQSTKESIRWWLLLEKVTQNIGHRWDVTLLSHLLTENQNLIQTHSWRGGGKTLAVRHMHSQPAAHWRNCLLFLLERVVVHAYSRCGVKWKSNLESGMIFSFKSERRPVALSAPHIWFVWGHHLQTQLYLLKWWHRDLGCIGKHEIKHNCMSGHNWHRYNFLAYLPPSLVS